MNGPFEVYASKDEIAIRRVFFALELVDAVTLDRVSRGLKEVKAHGLDGKPIVNASGLFVWLEEDIERLEKISIDPGVLPYEATERSRAQLNLERDRTQGRWPVTTIELPPRSDYPFGPGITGLRGSLVQNRAFLEPVPGAQVQLRWLDEDGNWMAAPTTSTTTSKRINHKGGDFVAILRFAPSDHPMLDVEGKLTVCLRVTLDGAERNTPELAVPLGRVTRLSDPNQSVFAWDELAP